jgi:hypothetical protein
LPRILAAQRHAEIRMRPESEGKRFVVGIFQEEFASQHMAFQTVLGRDAKIGRPHRQHLRIVDRCLELADRAVRIVLQHSPRSREYETMNGVAATVIGFQRIFAAVPIKRTAGDAAGKRKQDRYSTSRRPLFAVGEIRRRPECFNFLLTEPGSKRKTIKAQSGGDLRRGAGSAIVELQHRVLPGHGIPLNESCAAS